MLHQGFGKDFAGGLIKLLKDFGVLFLQKIDIGLILGQEMGRAKEGIVPVQD